MCSGGDFPALGASVPDGQIIARQGEADSFGLAGREVNAIKPAQLVWRSVR